MACVEHCGSSVPITRLLVMCERVWHIAEEHCGSSCCVCYACVAYPQSTAEAPTFCSFPSTLFMSYKRKVNSKQKLVLSAAGCPVTPSTHPKLFAVTKNHFTDL